MSAEPTLAHLNPKKYQRKKAITITTALFLIIGFIFLLYWLFFLMNIEETDDAYVAGNQVQVMSQVTGNVKAIYVDNTDFVQKGDLLLTLDDTDALLTLEQAKIALADQTRQIHQLIITNKQLLANIDVQKAALSKAETDFERRQSLFKSSAIGKEELQHAGDDLATARAELNVAIQQYNANNALILDTPIDQQPAVLQAANQVRTSWLDLQRTKIRAPVTGYISRRNVQVGSHITSESILMVIVPANELWVNANFKETQLADIRIGQPVHLVSDVYGKKVVYQGKVVGLDMGTGSAFSLLPAQNATGNWIKVVQRVPVRISLDEKEIAKHPLRIGLTMTASIDVSDTTGLSLANLTDDKVIYQNDALIYDLTVINKEIAEIIQRNITQ